MIKFLTPWDAENDGIASISRQLVPELANHCCMEIVPLRTGLSKRANLKRLVGACMGASLVHIEHNFAYFNSSLTPGIHPGFGRRIHAKIVLSVNEVFDQCNLVQVPKLKRIIKTFLLTLTNRWVFSGCDLLLCYTRYQKRLLEQLGVASSKMVHLPMPVLKFDFPKPERVRQMRKQIGLEQGEFGILLFGFVNRRKGIELAIEALAALPWSYKLIVGGGPLHPSDSGYLTTLYEKSKQLGVDERFYITGHLREEQIGPLFGACDMVVFPALSSYSSASLHRSMSYFRPTIAAQTEAVQEILEWDKCVECFGPGNIFELAGKIKKILEDEVLRTALSSACQMYAKRFSIQKRAIEISNIYKRLLRSEDLGHSYRVLEG